MPCKPGEDEYIPGQMTRPCGGEDPKHGLPPKPVGVEIMWQEGLKRSVRLRANVELMSRQVHALRDALAIARGRQAGKDGWAKAFRTEKSAAKKAGQKPKGAI